MTGPKKMTQQQFMGQKQPMAIRIGGVEARAVDMSPKDMIEEIGRLNSAMASVERALSRIPHSKHPALEEARFILQHNKTNLKREGGGWNRGKKKKVEEQNDEQDD